MKLRNLLTLGIVAALLLAAAFMTSNVQGAPSKQEGTGDGNVSRGSTTIQTTAEVAAYWTPERMASAQPMEIVITSGSGPQAPEPSSLKVTGDPVAIPGNGPGQLPASQLGLQTLPSPASAVTAWYPYPYPYATVQFGGDLPTRYPLNTNGKVFFTQNGGNYVCSGTSTTSGVGGNRRLAWTAGHCVHAGNGSSASWSTNVLFCPSYANGAAAVGCWSGINVWTTSSWYNSGNLKYDHGVIITSDTSTTGRGRLGDTIGTQGIAWNASYLQSFWEFGYPAAAPYNGAWLYLTTSSTGVADDPNSAWSGPYTIGVGSDMTGGSSGGGWIIGGAFGYLNSVNSYKYTSPAMPLAMYGPYFDSATGSLWESARVDHP
jgi:hypothetical protein